MASIRKEVSIDADPAAVWDALRDASALHTRLCPGFVTDCHVEGGIRTVTFGNGMVAREHIVSIDDDARRLAWAVTDAPFRHYNGVAQVLDEDGRTRFVWQADVLPHELAGMVGQMMEAGIHVIARTLGR